MVTVRATCPECGDVEMPAPTVEVRVVDAIDPTETRREARYVCPSCGRPRSVRLELNDVHTLRRVRARFVHIPCPAEARERVSDAPPITYDDLLDVALQLRCLP